jgi:hypothetical protein
MLDQPKIKPQMEQGQKVYSIFLTKRPTLGRMLYATVALHANSVRTLHISITTNAKIGAGHPLTASNDLSNSSIMPEVLRDSMVAFVLTTRRIWTDHI